MAPPPQPRPKIAPWRLPLNPTGEISRKSFTQCEGGTQMPANKDYKTRRAEMSGEDVKDGLCRGLGLLALPVLAFQRNMLGILRTGIEQAGLLKPLQTLIENELHAAMMIADPTGERRNS